MSMKEFLGQIFTKRTIVFLLIVFILGFGWGWLGAVIKMQRLLGQ